eukprot:CAMPEP_0185701054 /NCGR_PEP_ID=MMETSP1164-20130828/8390_1 /TAXON_ID=1104430 /ORGANISM="Chrysoreinhardia sp, Strain CCMP2950" /LENGTH=146 /DNA_ID=CAMNT_0028368039 /DNA_START=387 /DNA_END=823 /DNA_ORIENTATION=-
MTPLRCSSTCSFVLEEPSPPSAGLRHGALLCSSSFGLVLRRPHGQLSFPQRRVRLTPVARTKTAPSVVAILRVRPPRPDRTPDAPTSAPTARCGPAGRLLAPSFDLASMWHAHRAAVLHSCQNSHSRSVRSDAPRLDGAVGSSNGP